MLRSSAFLDYQQRFRGFVPLLRVAFDTRDPMLASASAKGAIVLAAAAAERYMNDALRQACHRLKVEEYDHLSEGQQAYICAQIARRIAIFDKNDEMVSSFNADRRARLKAAIQECAEAFSKPSAWPHMPEFGIFMDGAAAPSKINSVIKDFDPGRGDLFSRLDARASGRAPFIRALTELIDARHNAAHAKPATDPGPSDAQSWIVSSYWLVRAIETMLNELSPIEPDSEAVDKVA